MAQRALGGRRLGADSPLFGGRLPAAGAEDGGFAEPGYDPRPDSYTEPAAATAERAEPDAEAAQLDPPAQADPAPDAGPEALDDRRSAELLPAQEPGRALDDWGRSEALLALADPVLDFYYRYWFRVEAEGLENVPSEGGALLVANHSGALPPDAPMIMQAIRREHPAARPVYMLGEHWFKGYPFVGMLANKLGLVAAHPANAQRLLHDEGRLALVFPEGQKASAKVLWQRYRMRRFGRGGFVRTALRARVPIVPIAVVGAEEAMPIFAHLRPAQRLTGLIYFPVNHAFPHFGLAAAAMYLPAKFRIRFLDPLDMAELPPETGDDPAAVQSIAGDVRARIQDALDAMLAARRSVWLG